MARNTIIRNVLNSIDNRLAKHFSTTGIIRILRWMYTFVNHRLDSLNQYISTIIARSRVSSIIARTLYPLKMISKTGCVREIFNVHQRKRSIDGINDGTHDGCEVGWAYKATSTSIDGLLQRIIKLHLLIELLCTKIGSASKKNDIR